MRYNCLIDDQSSWALQLLLWFAVIICVRISVRIAQKRACTTGLVWFRFLWLISSHHRNWSSNRLSSRQLLHRLQEFPSAAVFSQATPYSKFRNAWSMRALPSWQAPFNLGQATHDFSAYDEAKEVIEASQAKQSQPLCSALNCLAWQGKPWQMHGPKSYSALPVAQHNYLGVAFKTCPAASRA